MLSEARLLHQGSPLVLVAEFSLCGFDSCDHSEKSAHFWGRAGEMLQVFLNLCHSPDPCQEKSQLWCWLPLAHLCGCGWAPGAHRCTGGGL